MFRKSLFALLGGILFAVFLCTLVGSKSDKWSVTLTYEETSKHVVASAERPSKKHGAVSYEFRGPALLELVDTNASGIFDELIFEVTGEGETELVFYSIDPAAPNDTYAHAHRCKISVSADVLDLDNRLWRR